MKHLRTVSRRPAMAADNEISIGQIIAVVAEILLVIGQALLGKEASS